jgi:hypothetical protein
VVKPLSANSTSLTRTLGIGASAMMAATPRSANAVGGPDLLLVLMADLHSGYAYTAALVKAVRDLVAANTTAQAAIVVNGDVFESGNVLCVRNNGKIDLEVLRIFANLAPTIVIRKSSPPKSGSSGQRSSRTLAIHAPARPTGFRALRSGSRAER